MAASKHLLIVYHSQTGNTERMAEAVLAGARGEEVSGVEARKLTCWSAGADDLLWAHGLVLGTPENFGYMSGGMKDFLDRTFYPVEGKLQPLPYAMIVSAGNDGTQAPAAIRRIANGYPFREVQAPVIAVGELTAAHIGACRELGLSMALGVEMGLF